MKIDHQYIFEKLFKKPFDDNSNKTFLEQITKDYPYFAPTYFFLTQEIGERDPDYKKYISINNLFFDNPHWLHFQLNKNNRDLSSHSQAIKPQANGNGDKEDSPEQIIFKLQTPVDEKLIFEPLHATDYFASQGIKLSEEAEPSDKLGKQLKSFTDWLKTMKKIHTEKRAITEEIIDTTVQNLAEKSNNDEEIITEAMAEVFIKQNKIKKAIEIFEKLSLLNPPKSAYFAAKIEQLKEN